MGLLGGAPQGSRAGWSFSTCAVVGHSGLLRGSGLGREIDHHKAVFRLDMAPTVRPSPGPPHPSTPSTPVGTACRL